MLCNISIPGGVPRWRSTLTVLKPLLRWELITTRSPGLIRRGALRGALFGIVWNNTQSFECDDNGSCCFFFPASSKDLINKVNKWSIFLTWCIIFSTVGNKEDWNEYIFWSNIKFIYVSYYCFNWNDAIEIQFLLSCLMVFMRKWGRGAIIWEVEGAGITPVFS